MKDKKTLITIIVLLVIFAPLAGFGTFKHFTASKGSNSGAGNPNKEFILNNKVYFYVGDKLQGTYDCKTCDIADTVIDDTVYHTNYYKDGSITLSGVINNYFSVFKESNNYILYNVMGNSVIDKYSKIKNYNIEATSSFLINNKADKWGVAFLEIGKKSIANEYDYIAIPSHLKNKKLDSSKFIVKKDNKWYIIDENGTNIVSDIANEIVDFNDKYYITYQDGYHIYDYDNNEYLSDFTKNNVYGVGKYLFVINDNQLYIYNSLEGDIIVKFVTLPEYKSLYFSIEEKGFDIIIDGNVTQTLELD